MTDVAFDWRTPEQARADAQRAVLMLWWAGAQVRDRRTGRRGVVVQVTSDGYLGVVDGAGATCFVDPQDAEKAAVTGQGEPMERIEMAPRPAADLLRDAAKLVDAALAQLNTDRHGACPGCGRPHFRNPPQAYVHERIAATPGKLRKAADDLAETVETERS